jgi:hypothetical protein
VRTGLLTLISANSLQGLDGSFGQQALPTAGGHPVSESAHERMSDPLRQRPRPYRSGDSSAVVVKQISNIWYVSIHLPHQEKTGHYSRRSQTFTTESDAKQFAAARIAEGIGVSAGTINPVVPKRLVGPAELKQWLSEHAK